MTQDDGGDAEETIMKGWLRRIRGALGMGLTWAVGWAPIGAVLGAALWFVLDPPLALMRLMTINATAFGVLGLVGGTIFATVLRLAAGSRRFEELTLPGFAALGAAGGLLLGGLAVFAGLWGAGGVPPVGIAVAAVATVLGATSAAGSLALARRAEDRPFLDGAGNVGGALPEQTQRSPIG